jgi:hypothetical protein
MRQFRDSPEAEVALYGYNAAVMHNGTSHDEQGNGNLWLMTARYAVAAGLHGVPMIYMTQPLGVAHKVNFESRWESIKTHWDGINPHVFTIYKRINQARADHPAVRCGHHREPPTKFTVTAYTWVSASPTKRNT